MLDKRALLTAVTALGYTAAEKLEGRAQLDREQELRAAELRRQKLNMWTIWPLAIVIMVLTMQGMWSIPMFMPASVKNWVLMALTSRWWRVPDGSSSAIPGAACGAVSPT